MDDEVPAGWYADPDDDGASQRYWDGDDWTEQTRPANRPRPAPVKKVTAPSAPPPQGPAWQPPPQQGMPQQPAPPSGGYGYGPSEPPKQKHTARNIILVIVAIFIIGGIASAAGGGGGSRSSSSSDSAVPAATDSGDPTAQATSKGASAGSLLLSVKGSGSKTTQKFTTGSDDWDLSYSYNCKNFGQEGNFAVLVYGKDGNLSLSNSSVNELGTAKTDITHFHNGGTYYLDITSECSWSIRVTTA